MKLDEITFPLDDDQLAAVVDNLDNIRRWELTLAKDAQGGEVHQVTADLLQALITTLTPETENDSGPTRGWVELKMIGDNGPYAYRRWREGGKLRSEYIGKVKD
jgi:hypothetical protein